MRSDSELQATEAAELSLRTISESDEAYSLVKALEDERARALRRAEEAEAKAAEEACKVKQLSQERTELSLQLEETEKLLEQRLEFAEKSLAQRLRAMEEVVVRVEAERDQYAAELAAYRNSSEVGGASGARAERKQIVEDLRALKSDAENSLEQRLEAAERELAVRLQGIEARVARAQETSITNGALANHEELIGALTREKAGLCAQLQEALAKIAEQENMMQDERATFWEELDLMRMDKERRSNGLAQSMPHVAPPMAAALTPSARVVRVNGKGVVESTPGALSSARHAFTTPTIAAPVAASSAMATPGQRAGYYP
jgi:hypothetical protein